MSPVEINEKSDPTGPDTSPCGRRASLKGFLSISLSKYLELLDRTGRQLRSGKRGTIPPELAPILERLGLDAAGWCDLVKKFGKLFKRAAGNAASWSSEAARRGQSYRFWPANGIPSSTSLSCFAALARTLQGRKVRGCQENREMSEEKVALCKLGS